MSAFAQSWLSASTQTMQARLDERRHQAFDCDVLVVGSGYGGAVAAARMAGSTVASGQADDAGRAIELWLVERGREYLRGMFPTRFSELPGHVRFSQPDGRPARGYAEALFDIRLGGDAHVLLGNGLGGGSLINAGVMARAAPEVWNSGWPDVLDPAAVEAGYAAAEAMLQPQRIPCTTAKFDVFAQLAQAGGAAAKTCPVAVNFTGRPTTPAGVEMQPCTLCGDCLTGCNQGAKGTLDTNYLALAAKREAQLFCGVTVERLIAPLRPGDAWQVLWHTTEPSLRPADGRPSVIRARRVVLAAGSLGSTEVLLRSKTTGLRCSERLGEKFSTNGDMLAAGLLHTPAVHATCDQEADPADPAQRKVGPTITGLAHAQADGQAFVVEEFAVPGALAQVFGEVTSSFGCLDMPDQADPSEETLAATGRVLTHSGLYGFIGDDGAAGRLELVSAPRGTPASIDAALRVVWPRLGEAPLFEAQLSWLRAACDSVGGPGGKAVPNPSWKPFGIELDQADFDLKPGAPISVHPLGGCAMAMHADDGVVDSAGRVFSHGTELHESLAVLDGSIVPRALAINPALTIAALAEQAVPVLCQAWGLKTSETPDEIAIGPRPVWAGRLPVPRQASAVRIRESLQGRLAIGADFFWARLQLQFEEIGNLGELLRLPDKVVRLRSAQLFLYPATADTDEFSRRAAEVVVQAALQGQVRLFVADADPDERVRELRYELQVTEVRPGSPGSLSVGQRILGIKKVARGSGSVWRQLSMLDLHIDGAPGAAGTLCLDLDDLANRREALLSLTRQSTAPDALADLAGLASFVLRVFLRGQIHTLAPDGDYPDALVIANLQQRLPGALQDGRCPQVQRFGPYGARLSHYRPDGLAKGRPVLVIHGYGASGSTFAHTSIPVNLVDFLLARGRDAWVLDLRTSIGNEPDDPQQPRGGPWRFDEVAGEDIPAALDIVAAASGPRVDVIAHCIGAAMFSVAALDVPAMRQRVGAVVLSQVGPVLRMSPANRLRGYLASYVQQFIGSEEFDVRHEFRRELQPDGSVAWKRDPAAARLAKLIDVLLTSFPYDDAELKKQEGLAEELGVDFRTVRRRSDAIWGHLMEFDNVDGKTWQHLDAINGWVKVRSLAQTIHYARHGLLTDASGRNRSLRQELFEQRFDFPVLLLHGQRNRVFDWRGSLDGFELLNRLRGGAEQLDPDEDPESLRWGKDGSVQLLVLRRYGHQDCIVGKGVAGDVFAHLVGFLDKHGANPPAKGQPPQPLPIQFEPPWIGPMAGALADAGSGQWSLRLLAHPDPRRARTLGAVLVPLDPTSGEPRLDLARGLVPPGVTPPSRFGAPRQARDDHAQSMREKAFALRLSASQVPANFERFIVLTVHSDLMLDPGQVFDTGMTFMKLETALHHEWLANGLRLHARAREALEEQLPQLQADKRLHHAELRLGSPVFAAASSEAAMPAPLRFALVSCQYPPGLMDEAPAAAACARLADHALQDRAPQFLLAAGDQVYMDATAGVFDPGAAGQAEDVVNKAYELNWRMPRFRDVAARLPIYPMLDDHELRDNWQPRPGAPSDPDIQHALDAFACHQGALQPVPLQPGGWHYAFRPAGALVLVLDTRTQRDLRRVDATTEGVDWDQARIVAQPVLEEVCRRLKAADPKAAKFIVTPSPLLPAECFAAERPQERLRSDGWSGYPRSMLDLLGFIRDEGIERVVLLCGDAHGSAVCKLALDGGPAVFAVMSSGLYAPWPFANARAQEFVLDGRLDLELHGQRIGGRMHTAAWSSCDGYALIELDGDTGDPHAILSVSLCAADGGHIVCKHAFGGEDWRVEEF